MMNLDFENNNYRFNARTSAIIYDKTNNLTNDEVLNDYYDSTFTLVSEDIV